MRHANGKGVHKRYLGALVGLAVGDALGAPIEGRPPGSFAPIEGMVGGGTWGLEAGHWTDDTSMALCLASSLVESGGFQAKDQMDRYVRWMEGGYFSSTDSCFGISETILAALKRYKVTGEPYAGLTGSDTACNGSLMRLAPIPMYLLHDAARAVDLAAEMSRTTHGAREAVDACRYLTGLLIGALRGDSKSNLLSDLYSPVYNYWFFQHVALTPCIDSIARGVYKYKECSELPATGHVVDTLEAALWAFERTTTFKDGALLAVNLGNDADTTGAVYGQLAGAYYGIDAIPTEWSGRLVHFAIIKDLATALLKQTSQSIRHFTEL